jgi:hypothetical protein
MKARRNSVANISACLALTLLVMLPIFEEPRIDRKLAVNIIPNRASTHNSVNGRSNKKAVKLSIGQSAIRRQNRRPRSQTQTQQRTGDTTMRVMVIVKANTDSEAGVMPNRELLAKMGEFNEGLVKAGVLLAGDGLQPSSKGKRVRFSGDNRTVIDGPFTETKELIAGFWVWQVRSMQEAVEWLKRAPFDGGEEVEIRPLFEASDFGENLTPELKERDQRLRQQIAGEK